MSRLPPALGFQAGAGAGQGPSKQQQAFEQDTGFLMDKVHLLPREAVDASLQGGNLDAGLAACWHPKLPILAVATSAALVEYDAISGCRRNYVEVTGSPVKLRYSPDGTHIVLLTKERNLFSWSTTTWRRRTLLSTDATKYATRPLVSGLLAVTGGVQPVVYYSPVGKLTLRTVYISPPATAKGARPDREYTPGVKLRTENKKPIVALAAHPADPQILIMLLVDGSLLVCGVSGGAWTVLCGVAVPFTANIERVQLHALPHPTRPGAALLLVEAERSGLSVLAIPSRHEVRVLATLSCGAGTSLCGAGLLHRSSILLAAARNAGGNVAVRAWRLLGDSRGELSVLQASSVPGTLWDALQGHSAGGGALADISGEAMVAGMLPHGPSGLLAFWTTQHDETGAGHLRLPLLQVVDGGDPLEGTGAPRCVQLHTGLAFWTAADGQDGMVTKLRFPRYMHVISGGRLCSYDLTHGLLADFLVLHPTNAATQERVLRRVVKSSRQGLWLAFLEVLTGREGAPLAPGQHEFTAVAEGEAAVAPGKWFMPGRDGAFVGSRDELTVVLSNSGGLLAVFDSAKLAQPGATALYAAEFKDGPVAALFPGPPSHVPSAPVPRPDEAAGEDAAGAEGGDDTDSEAEAEMREWEDQEVKRLQLPRRVLLLTDSNKLCMADISQGASSYGSQSRMLAAKHTLPLRPGEAVVQVAWQTLLDPGTDFHAGCPGADTALPCVAAVVTSERALIVDPCLNVLVSVTIPGDMGTPVSCLWLGPALLLSTSANQVLQVTWEGRMTHLASLLTGPPVALVAALADRLVVAAKGPAPALVGGRTEVASRGFAVLLPMLAGWAGLAARGILPGGAGRARRELRTLLCSYDASQLPVATLQHIAMAGFADVAAAAAAQSELPAVTPARKAALAAAAGNWAPVVDLVTAELEAGETYPHPPPKRSPVYNKTVALARACEAHGFFTQARSLLEAAGAWNELLALCVFQGDFLGLQAYARLGGRDVQALADQLAAVNEDSFRRVSNAYGGRPNTDDWKVEVVAPGGFSRSKGKGAQGGEQASSGSASPREILFAEGPRGERDGSDVDGGMAQWGDVDVAPAGRLPYMEASLRVTTAAAASGLLPPPAAAAGGEGGDHEEEGVPIQRLDLNTLEAYLGVAGASVNKSALAGLRGAAAAAAAPLAALSRTETSTSSEAGTALAAAHAAAAAGAGDESVPDSEADAMAAAAAAVARGETPAQAAARAAFAKDGTAAASDEMDDFFSSDEDDTRPDADTASVQSFGTSASQRFKFSIRPPDAAPRPGDFGSLRAAASSLKLGGPGSTAPGSPAGPSRSPSMGPSPAKDPRAALSTSSSLSRDSFDAFPSLLPSIAVPSRALAAAPSPGGPSDDPFAAMMAGGPAQQPAKQQKPPGPAADPFAGLAGLPSLSQAQATAADSQAAAAAAAPSSGRATQSAGAGAAELSEKIFTEQPAASTAPMRPLPAAAVAQSDLLAGWDQFEAMFGGGAETPAAPSAAQPKGPTPQQGAAMPSPFASTLPAAPQPQASSSLQSSAPDRHPGRLVPGTNSVSDSALAHFVAGRWGPAAHQLACCRAKIDYAAAELLRRAAEAPPPAAGRLARYAAAIPLERSHWFAREPLKEIVAAFAAEANMATGNYGYAADRLTWLLVQAAEGLTSGAGLDLAQLQQRLDQCDSAGGANADLPADEDVESFAAILGSCDSIEEVDELLANLA